MMIISPVAMFLLVPALVVRLESDCFCAGGYRFGEMHLDCFNDLRRPLCMSSIERDRVVVLIDPSSPHLAFQLRLQSPVTLNSTHSAARSKHTLSSSCISICLKHAARIDGNGVVGCGGSPCLNLWRGSGARRREPKDSEICAKRGPSP